jgi:hypothetical protein
MKTVPLNQLFDVEYGNKFDLNKMQLLSKSEGGINFVNRSARNCGVSATVAPHESTLPYEAGNITVSLGGSFLSSFVQLEKFYTGQNVAVLPQKKKCPLRKSFMSVYASGTIASATVPLVARPTGLYAHYRSRLDQNSRHG